MRGQKRLRLADNETIRARCSCQSPSSIVPASLDLTVCLLSSWWFQAKARTNQSYIGATSRNQRRDVLKRAENESWSKYGTLQVNDSDVTHNGVTKNDMKDGDTSGKMGPTVKGTIASCIFASSVCQRTDRALSLTSFKHSLVFHRLYLPKTDLKSAFSLSLLTHHSSQKLGGHQGLCERTHMWGSVCSEQTRHQPYWQSHVLSPLDKNSKLGCTHNGSGVRGPLNACPWNMLHHTHTDAARLFP